MSRYHAYPDYKDSGVEWLGNIPKSWPITRHKYVATFKKGKNPEALFDEPLGEKIKYLSMEYLRGKSAPKFAKVESNSYVSEEGQVLIIWDGSNAGEFVKGTSGIVSSTMAASEFISEIDSRFYWYACLCIEPEIRRHANGMGIPHVDGSKLKNSLIPIPQVSEQEQIANFLDYETAKIDTLIDKQQQLIKLLKEKRQAVISHAVTKGLNPDAPMKDLGVEWLGEVPEHWEVKRFKNIFKIRKRIAGKLGYDVLSITQRGIKVKDIESGEGQLSMDYSKYQIVEVGDFAMNHMDLLTGFVDVSKFKGITSPDYRVFTVEEKTANKGYFLYLLQMGYINKLFYPFGQGAAHIGRWRLPTEAFNEFLAPYPPAEEQLEIEAFIRVNLERIEMLEKKAVSAIELMKERRAALISAAVTGKIDVRNWRPAEQENSQQETCLEAAL